MPPLMHFRNDSRAKNLYSLTRSFKYTLSLFGALRCVLRTWWASKSIPIIFNTLSSAFDQACSLLFCPKAWKMLRRDPEVSTCMRRLGRVTYPFLRFSNRCRNVRWIVVGRWCCQCDQNWFFSRFTQTKIPKVRAGKPSKRKEKLRGWVPGIER